MAQKTNPISLRLGKNQVWGSSLQNYGKTKTINFKFFHIQLHILKYLNRISYFNNLSLNRIEWSVSKNRIYLNIYSSHIVSSENFNFHKYKKEILETINQFIFLNIFIRFYFKKSWYSISELIFFYIQYLIKKDFSLKKIIVNINKIFKNCLNLEKISYLKDGPTKLKLVGFKIRLAGRFENSRNQMAKVTKCSSGLLSLTSLQYYTEYVKFLNLLCIYSKRHI